MLLVDGMACPKQPQGKIGGCKANAQVKKKKKHAKPNTLNEMMEKGEISLRQFPLHRIPNRSIKSAAAAKSLAQNTLLKTYRSKHIAWLDLSCMLCNFHAIPFHSISLAMKGWMDDKSSLQNEKKRVQWNELCERVQCISVNWLDPHGQRI